MLPPLWLPSPKDKGAPKIPGCSWLKGKTEISGSTKAYQDFSVLGIVLGMLAPDLRIRTRQWAERKGHDEKEAREQRRVSDHTLEE